MVVLWDITSGEAKGSLQRHTGPVESVVFSQDGTTLGQWELADRTVVLWDVASGQEKATLQWAFGVCQFGGVFSGWDHSGQWGFSDGRVVLWNVASGQWKATLQGHSNRSLLPWFFPRMGPPWPVEVRTVTVFLCCGMWPATRRRQPFKGIRMVVNSVAFSPDGATLASGSRKEILLWDVASKQEKGNAFQGHTLAGNFSVAFSPDGTTLASGG